MATRRGARLNVTKLQMLQNVSAHDSPVASLTTQPRPSRARTEALASKIFAFQNHGHVGLAQRGAPVPDGLGVGCLHPLRPSPSH